MKEKEKDCGCGNKKPKITMSTPKGMEFNTPYSVEGTSTTLDTIKYNEHYFDTNRNGKDDIQSTKVKEPNEIVEFHNKLDAILRNVGNLLKSKNEAYGNTSLNPPKIFSKLDSSEALCARIDDKIMRIKNRGLVSATEDTLTDLIGYLLLLKMSRKK
tara:strand:+ start:293 stop:763 length:471 start_codon:yes stop_codon:yes gene_type:complete